MVFLKKPVKIGTGECCLKNGLKKGLQKFWCSPTHHRIWHGSNNKDDLNISPLNTIAENTQTTKCNPNQIGSMPTTTS